MFFSARAQSLMVCPDTHKPQCSDKLSEKCKTDTDINSTILLQLNISLFRLVNFYHSLTFWFQSVLIMLYLVKVKVTCRKER